MIRANHESRVAIQTANETEGYGYTLQSMVRVLGLAMQAEHDAADKESIVDCLVLLGDMLPGPDQIILVPSPKGGGNKSSPCPSKGGESGVANA